MTRKRSGVPAVVLVVVTLVTGWMLVASRSSSGQSPDDWRQLSLADFVRVMTELTSGEEPLSDALWTEIRSQAAERLLPVVAAGTAADYGDLVSLFLWARPVLTADQVTTVLAGLQPPANQLAGWTFERMRTVQDRMLEAGMPIAAVHDVTCTWLGQRNVRTLENVDQLGWLFSQLELVDRQEIGPQEFSVTWTGLVRAGRRYVYVFPLPAGLELCTWGHVPRAAHVDLGRRSTDPRLHHRRLDLSGTSGGALRRAARARAGGHVLCLHQRRCDRRPAGRGPALLGRARTPETTGAGVRLHHA